MTQRIRILGVPMDLGQDRRGVDMGPAAVRMAGLLGRVAELGLHIEDGGDLAVPRADQQQAGDPHAKFLKEIAASCRAQAESVEQTLATGAMPLVLGGDHSIAIGTVSGVSGYLRQRGQKSGLIWLDAHGDYNTPQSSPSGNIHGMGLACLAGRGPLELSGLGGFRPKVDAANTVLIGVHDLDAGERRALREDGIRVLTMRDIDERGLRAVMEEAIAVAGAGTAGLCVSLDLDFIDAAQAPGVGTPVRGGATYREAHLAMELLADSGSVLAMEVVEVNPVLDEHNRTAELAVELILSGLGKKIF